MKNSKILLTTVTLLTLTAIGMQSVDAATVSGAENSTEKSLNNPQNSSTDSTPTQDELRARFNELKAQKEANQEAATYNKNASDEKNAELTSQHKVMDIATNQVAATNNLLATPYKYAEIEAQEAAAGNPNSISGTDYKNSELQAQHEEQQTELRAEFNNLKAAKYNQSPSDYKATELQAQHEEQQTELRAEFNNLKAAKYNQSPSAYKDAEISAQEASIGNPDNIKDSDYKTAVLKRQASEKEAQEHNISGTDYRKSVTKLQELNKKDSAKTTETTETTNKVAGKEAVKVNPIVSSGTVSIHSAQPESAKAVKATATGTKAITTSATKSANQNEIKTLAASLPTTGDDAGFSIFLTFIGMILFGAVGVILALFQKHGRHSK
ncbi:hypothetical protein OQI88_06585 [Lactococcus lactis]|uniref:hypothetical protein n=1 Tax=Lactococcus lactis TaxID=1358 RepID=UPI0015C34729|nr:hypothetical protein [Lactococcus lactis]MCT0077701.1 hypothetical protein [Lactococcus lactis subsp. lactis]MDH5114152.1 hypothetical protein [Lactococcus lactis]QLF89892.1 hypothetical protein HPC60_03960 [Lactococcus lactis subsp. lactis]